MNNKDNRDGKNLIPKNVLPHPLLKGGNFSDSINLMKEKKTNDHGGGDGPSGIETRLTRLEVKVDHIETQLGEIKTDMREIRSDIRNINTTLTWMPFKTASWMLGLFIVAGGILKLIASVAH